MGRRRRRGAREPNGRAQRQDRKDWPPTKIRRIIDDALDGYGNSLFGSTLGQLALRRKIDAYHVAAGQRWAGLSARYHAATGAPSGAHSAALELGLHSSAPDVDSMRGRELSLSERDVIERRLKAEHALMAISHRTFELVCDVCEANRYPPAWDYERLKAGLHRLAELWSLTPKAG